MATVAGYKAALMAADGLPRMFPMLMTAAGTVAPARVLGGLAPLLRYRQVSDMFGGGFVALYRRHLRNGECVARLPEGLALRMSAAESHRDATLQVRQGEGLCPVASIRGAEQRKERRVLVDRQELAIGLRPAFGCERERKNPDFAEKWFSHGFSP